MVVFSISHKDFKLFTSSDLVRTRGLGPACDGDAETRRAGVQRGFSTDQPSEIEVREVRRFQSRVVNPLATASSTGRLRTSVGPRCENLLSEHAIVIAKMHRNRLSPRSREAPR